MKRNKYENNYTIYSVVLLLSLCVGSSAGWGREDAPAMITIAAFLTMLTAVAVQDMTALKIADEYHVMILAVAGISCFTMPELSLVSRAIGFVCVSVPLLLITLIVPGAFGGGDIKLMAVCGVFLGWRITLVSATIALFLGGVWGICLLAVKRTGRKERFAFGPFLCMGMAAGLFAGDWLMKWCLAL